MLSILNNYLLKKQKLYTYNFLFNTYLQEIIFYKEMLKNIKDFRKMVKNKYYFFRKKNVIFMYKNYKRDVQKLRRFYQTVYWRSIQSLEKKVNTRYFWYSNLYNLYFYWYLYINDIFLFYFNKTFLYLWLSFFILINKNYFYLLEINNINKLYYNKDYLNFFSDFSIFKWFLSKSLLFFYINKWLLLKYSYDFFYLSKIFFKLKGLIFDFFMNDKKILKIRKKKNHIFFLPLNIFINSKFYFKHNRRYKVKKKKKKKFPKTFSILTI